MAFCRKCGTELREGEDVCPQCGTPVTGTEMPRRQPVTAYGTEPPRRSNVSTIAVLAVVGGIIIAGIFALVMLIPEPGPEPGPAPEGGYDVTFDLNNVVVSTDDDTFLNIMKNGKYYNPVTKNFDLTSPSSIAQISLSVTMNDEPQTIDGVASGTLSGNSSTPMSASDVVTVHVDKDVTKAEFLIFLVTSYEGHEGTVIDMNTGEGTPSTTGQIIRLTMTSEPYTETLILNGDLRPCATSGTVTVTVTPMP